MKSARPRWWQFSLLSLLLLLVAGCAVAAWIGEIRRREEALRDAAELRSQLRALRTEVGITDDQSDFLNITDDKQIHIRALTPGDMTWRWRVYVPPGKQWHVMISHGTVWDPATQQYTGEGGCGSSLKLDGEFTLEARLMRDLEGRAMVSVLHWRGGSSCSIPEKGARTFLTNGKVTAKMTGMPKQETFAAQGQIPLIRFHRERGTLPSSPYSRSAQPIDSPEPAAEYGMSIWLDEALQLGGSPGPAPPGGKAGGL